MQYRRSKTGGGRYFFTVVTENRHKIFTNDETVDLLRQAFYQVMEKRPFVVDAAVILPDHLHCIWTLPENDNDFPVRWRLIKTWFTKHCGPEHKRHPGTSRIKRKEQGIWQRRYWEHLIRDDMDYEHHVHYIHYNQVKHNYCREPAKWPYSSIHKFIRQGIVARDWGSSGIVLPDTVGHE